MNKDLSNIIEKIYAAATEPTLWQECIDAINEVVDGRVGFIYSYNAKTNETTDGYFTSDHNQDYLKRFLDYYVLTNPYPEPIHNRAPAGIPLFDEMVLPREEARQTEYYNDWVKPQGLDITQIGCKVVIDQDNFVTLGTHVRPDNYDEQMPYYHDILATLIPHITRAVKINKLIKSQQETTKNLNSVFDRLDLAIFILDRQKKIISSNLLAESLLKRGDIVTLQHGISLCASHPSCIDRLNSTIDDCFSPKEDLNQDTFTLVSTIDQTRFVAWIETANEDHLQSLSEKAFPMSIVKEEPRVAVVISIPQTHKGPDFGAVQTLLDVTRAEAKLAAALANGETLKSYAENAGISNNTARGQLSSIFNKTGMKRQAELVAHIWRSVGPIRR